MSARKGGTSEDSRTPSTSVDPKMAVGDITMGFITTSLHSKKGNNAVLVIVDRLTKLVRFIPFKLRQSTELLAEKCMQEVVRLPAASYQIEMPDFYLTFGRVFKKV